MRGTRAGSGGGQAILMTSPGAVQSASHLGQSGEVSPGAQDLWMPVISEPGAEVLGPL